MALLTSALVRSFTLSGTEQGDDVPVDLANVRGDRAWLLGAPAFSENEAGVQVGEVEVAQLFDRDRPIVELLLFCRVFAFSDTPQLHLRFLAGPLGSPDAVQANRKASRSLTEPILNDVAALAGGEHSEAETGQLVVPNDVIFFATVCGVDDPFSELRHGLPPTLPFPLA